MKTVTLPTLPTKKIATETQTMSPLTHSAFLDRRAEMSPNSSSNTWQETVWTWYNGPAKSPSLTQRLRSERPIRTPRDNASVPESSPDTEAESPSRAWHPKLSGGVYQGREGRSLPVRIPLLIDNTHRGNHSAKRPCPIHLRPCPTHLRPCPTNIVDLDRH